MIAGTYIKDIKLHDPQRPAPYKNYGTEFNLRKIEFPMKLSDIPRFERQNNMSISLYGYQDGRDGQEGFVYPLKVSKDVKERHVDLLLIANDDTNHYCYIQQISLIAVFKS